MITFKKISNEAPYNNFINYYNLALEMQENQIEAISISSYDPNKSEVNSRFVNLKYIIEDEWIFFSNYNSPKARQFDLHNQISCIFHWKSINIQIRLKANIFKTDAKFSDVHFLNRSTKKNALAVSSMQSETVKSFKTVKDNYQKCLNNESLLKCRPVYWGGFSFKPYYFEFWEGSNERLNKREVFQLADNHWQHSLIQP